MRIGASWLPIVIIDGDLLFPGVTGRERLRLRRIEPIANVVVNQLIFVMIIPLVMINLI